MKKSDYLFPATITISLLLTACGKAPTSPKVSGPKKGSVYNDDKDRDQSADSNSGNDQKPGTGKPSNPSDDDSSSSDPSTPPPSDPIADNKPDPSKPDPVKPDPIKPDPVKPDPVVPTDPNAPVTACATLDFTKITKIEEVLCLGSREKVFQVLPDLLKASFTLMEKSRSAQEASLQDPRVIIASQDGSLLLGAATGGNGIQDLEIALYDYEKNTYDFAGIDFSTNPPKVERELCKTCHGAEPRPIWAAYSNWDGAFEPTNRGLTAPQAEVLNKLAKGDTQSPILKALKYRSSYAANRLFSAATGLAETETNEMIGIMMAVKRGQMLSHKLLNDQKVSKAQIGRVISDALCGNSTSTIESLGYLVKDHLNTGIAGLDDKNYRFRNPNIGFQNLNTYFGHVLLKMAMDKDPALKASISSADKLYYNNANWNSLTGKGLGAFLAQAKTARKGYVSFRDHVNGELKRSVGNGSEICNAVKAYQ